MNKLMDEYDAQTVKLPVIVCQGFHDSALTKQFVRSLPVFIEPYIVDVTTVSPFAVYQWLQQTFGHREDGFQLPLVGIGFSAGVVGLAGALAMWRAQGGNVARLIAVDGWGVPVLGVPMARLSHDRFTHLSTLPLDVVGELLGDASKVNFYADPAVEHLDLWGDSTAANGWSVERWQLDKKVGVPMSASDFVRQLLHAEWTQAFEVD
ncbi:MAG: hypothetical protein AAFP03_08625 [Cyanobacteria bacterium J06598_3]